MRIPLLRLCAVTLLAFGATAGAAPQDPDPEVIVLSVEPGGAAATAGLRPDDRLVGWRREAAPPANADPAEGRFRVPGDVVEVEIEQAPRGATTLDVLRDGRPMEMRMPPGLWLLDVRPTLRAGDLEGFVAARAQVTARDAAEVAKGLAAWSALAARWRETQPLQASWIDLRIAACRTGVPEREAAVRALHAAQVVADRGADLTRAAQLAFLRGRAADAAGDLAGARAAYADAQARWERLRPQGLMVAFCVSRLAGVALAQSRLADAERLHLLALDLRGRAAPDSLEFAASHNNLAIVAGQRGDYEAAERRLRTALAIWTRVCPRTPTHAAGLLNLGIVQRRLGLLADAESSLREAVAIHEGTAPETIEMARALDNLGNTLQNRGHLEAAVAVYTRAVRLAARYGNARDEASVLTNQAVLEQVRGETRAAAALFERALALHAQAGTDSTLAVVPVLLGQAGASDDLATRRRLLERAREIVVAKNPDGIQLSVVLGDLGALALESGALDEAQDLLQASLAQAQRLAPGARQSSLPLRRLGELAMARGELATAEGRLRAALAIETGAFPGSDDEALTRYWLGRVMRRQGRTMEAREMLTAALAALDSQVGLLGGSIEVRSRFRASFARLHFEAIDLLVELRQGADAFRVLEAWRARELLAALGRRDTPLPDLPPDLDRRRRTAEARYRRLLGDLLDATADERDALLEEVVGAGRELADVGEAIQTVAPRLATFRQGSVLDLEEARGALAPGTLLLAFAVGEDHGFLFAAGPGPDEFTVDRVRAGRKELAESVGALRAAVSRPSIFRGWRTPAESLSTLLLSPVADRIGRAKRLLILPDGPLQFAPFAALPVPRDRGRALLVERVPLHVAASATTFAELTSRRRPERKRVAVVFADPALPRADNASSGWRGLGPLPGARREAALLRDLFGSAATIFTGAEATEQRVKSVGTEVTHLHLGCHGVLDVRSPLDSSLALAAGGSGDPEDGRLQAWEVLEQVRLDADLVVLSACDTALGEELRGEGVLGIARAFQFAGARAVLSTQWAVHDASAPQLIEHFYRGLRDGVDTAESLRRAQLWALARRSTAHPFYWAGFQLDGDWR